MTETTPTARAASDPVEHIRRLTIEYAHFVDSFQLPQILGLWAADASFDERPIGRALNTGVESIRQLFEADFADRRASAHFITNHLIETVDPGRARGSCYALVFAEYHSAPPMRACVRYTDDYVLSVGGWRFQLRKVELLTPLERTGPQSSPGSVTPVGP